jgi:hypothetical protein
MSSCTSSLTRSSSSTGAIRPRPTCGCRWRDLLLDAGDADLEELVEVARHDAQEAQALEQRHGGVGGLRQHAALERSSESSRLRKCSGG